MFTRTPIHVRHAQLLSMVNWQLVSLFFAVLAPCTCTHWLLHFLLHQSTSLFLFLYCTAYPMFDPDRLQQLSEPITAFLLKSSPTINCVVLEGALSQFYSVEWWKGTTLVYNSTNNPANSPRFSVQELGLVIQNVTGSDASEGYFCRVTVLDPIESRTTTVVGTCLS